MRFRAVLIDVAANQERPVQVLGNNLEELKQWAGRVLAGASDGAAVNIYQTTEVWMALIPKPRAAVAAETAK